MSNKKQIIPMDLEIDEEGTLWLVLTVNIPCRYCKAKLKLNVKLVAVDVLAFLQINKQERRIAYVA